MITLKAYGYDRDGNCTGIIERDCPTLDFAQNVAVMTAYGWELDGLGDRQTARVIVKHYVPMIDQEYTLSDTQTP